MAQKARVSVWPGVIALAIATAYLIALLAVERQAFIIMLLAAGVTAVVAATWTGLLESVSAVLCRSRGWTGGLCDHRRTGARDVFP